MSDRAAALDPAARESLRRILDRLATDPRSLTSVRDTARAWDVHVADSLAGLEVPELRRARSIADLGSGAGFPGLVLAAALPDAKVDLVESVGRKAGFIAEAAELGGLANATAIPMRSEEWAREPAPAGGRERYDVATARAVGSLASIAELASPLLRRGGVLVAWKGRRDAAEEAELGAVAEHLAMAQQAILPVRPYAASRNRHLHVLRKSGPTPATLPRRPGRAGRP